MVSQAITAFFIILFVIFIIILIFNGILNKLIDGVITDSKENFISKITGLETSNEKKIKYASETGANEVNRKIPLITHREKGYNQNNFQVASDIPLSQTSYPYFINKYYINPNINKSVDEDMEIHDSVNINKPDFLYDGIWKPNYRNAGDYQRTNWSPVHPINESRGKLGINKLLEQARSKPMPNEMEFNLCNTNPLPFNEFDKLCESSMNSELTGIVNDKRCTKDKKDDDIVCFQVYLDPLSK
jgi:hypothetical protein